MHTASQVWKKECATGATFAVEGWALLFPSRAWGTCVWDCAWPDERRGGEQLEYTLFTTHSSLYLVCTTRLTLAALLTCADWSCVGQGLGCLMRTREGRPRRRCSRAVDRGCHNVLDRVFHAVLAAHHRRTVDHRIRALERTVVCPGRKEVPPLLPQMFWFWCVLGVGM